VLGGVERIVSWQAARSTGDRAARYREQAGRFEQMAKLEAQPRARARLLELAGEYQFLADRARRSTPDGQGGIPPN
jgi:hypothetical protein